MEKQFKPVPDVECLKYHGTPEKPDIKIFVSHRIDLDSETIDNPLYIPVRCGAVYDERENIKTLGDNTGDNISEMRIDLCEYTVMYWAWKNIKADYYGLCHYRRYLAFTDKQFEEWNEQRFYYEQELNNESAAKYGLCDFRTMAENIAKYDITTSVTYETDRVPIYPRQKTVRGLFVNHPGLLTSEAMINKAVESIERDYPQFADSFLEELESPLHRGFNCFVMKKKLFDQFAEYLFGVLFHLNKCVENGEIHQSCARELGYVGEIIYGSFIRWTKNQNRYSFSEKHIVLFWDTEKKESNKTAFNSAYTKFKSLLKKVLPAYRTALRTEEKLIAQESTLALQQELLMQLNTRLASIQREVDAMNQRTMNTFWTQQHSFSYNTDEEKLLFWKNYPKATGDLRIIQRGSAALLKRYKAFCDQLGIKFWLHGGSLIGGLRHQGIVPWDDDIDIAMLREDFEKIVDFLKDNDTYAILNYYYIAIGTRSYRFIRTDLDAKCFVDIFVYDHYSLISDDDYTDWQHLRHNKRYLTKMLIDLTTDRKEYPTDPLLKDYPELKMKADVIFEQYIRQSQSFKEAPYLIWGLDNNYENSEAFAWKHGRIFKYEDIFPLHECIFEGETYFVPNDYEKYAFAEYGIRYVEMPKNMGEAVHIKEFFSSEDDILHAKELLEKEMEIRE